MTAGHGYQVFFDAVPEVGTRISYFGQPAELVGVEPYTNRKGEASSLLVWKAHDGRIGTTGLRSKSMTWRSA